MNKVTLVKVAQEIASHAANPPKQPGDEGRRVNLLSPHFERLTVELIRKYVIQNTQAARAQIITELAQLRTLIPEPLHSQFDRSCATIHEILQSIYQ